MSQTDIPSTQEISMFIHCRLCGEEWKSSSKINTKHTPAEYARLSVGWTKQGIQVWCHRHNCNVIHVDFEGVKHHANMGRQSTDEEEKLK